MRKDMKIRLVVEVSGTDVPPDWGKDVERVVRREMQLQFGERASVFLDGSGKAAPIGYGEANERVSHLSCPRCTSPYKGIRNYVAQYVDGGSTEASGFREVMCDDGWHLC